MFRVDFVMLWRVKHTKTISMTVYLRQTLSVLGCTKEYYKILTVAYLGLLVLLIMVA